MPYSLNVACTAAYSSERGEGEDGSGREKGKWWERVGKGVGGRAREGPFSRVLSVESIILSIDRILQMKQGAAMRPRQNASFRKQEEAPAVMYMPAHKRLASGRMDGRTE